MGLTPKPLPTPPPTKARIRKEVISGVGSPEGAVRWEQGQEDGPAHPLPILSFIL